MNTRVNHHVSTPGDCRQVADRDLTCKVGFHPIGDVRSIDPGSIGRPDDTVYVCAGSLHVPTIVDQMLAPQHLGVRISMEPYVAVASLSRG